MPVLIAAAVLLGIRIMMAFNPGALALLAVAVSVSLGALWPMVVCLTTVVAWALIGSGLRRLA